MIKIIGKCEGQISYIFLSYTTFTLFTLLTFHPILLTIEGEAAGDSLDILVRLKDFKSCRSDKEDCSRLLCLRAKPDWGFINFGCRISCHALSCAKPDNSAVAGASFRRSINSAKAAEFTRVSAALLVRQLPALSC